MIKEKRMIQLIHKSQATRLMTLVLTQGAVNMTSIPMMLDNTPMKAQRSKSQPGTKRTCANNSVYLRRIITTSRKRKTIETHQMTAVAAANISNTIPADALDLNERGARIKITALKAMATMVCTRTATQGTLFELTLLIIAGRRRSSPETKSRRPKE